MFDGQGVWVAGEPAGIDPTVEGRGAGEFTVVRVTGQDRLAGFGMQWLSVLLACDGVGVEVLHPKGSAGRVEELLADFMSLVATFSGRMYGIRVVRRSVVCGT